MVVQGRDAARADGVALLESEVRELVRRRGVDPVAEPERFAELVEQAAADYADRAARGVLFELPDMAEVVREVHDAVGGLGPLQPYLDDPEVEEIWVNSPTHVYVARRGVSELTSTVLTTEQVRDLVERMLKTSGRRLDLSSPFVDARLPGGERLHVVIPDITRTHFAVNIRKHVVRAHSLADMVRLGSLTGQAATFLDAAVRSGLNILVSGVTPDLIASRVPFQMAVAGIPFAAWQAPKIPRSSTPGRARRRSGEARRHRPPTRKPKPGASPRATGWMSCTSTARLSERPPAGTARRLAPSGKPRCRRSGTVRRRAR